MPDSPTETIDPQPRRPLPESLTRFLSAPVDLPLERAPGDGAFDLRPPPPLPANLALTGAIIWAVVYNIVGFALLWWVWSTMSVQGS